MTSNGHILSSLSILGTFLAIVLLLSVAIIFDSHDHIWLVTWSEKKKNSLNPGSLHPFSMKQKPKDEVYSDAKTDVRICLNLRYWKSYDVTNTLWRHYSLVNANLNKSLCPLLHLNALYPLAFVSLKKDESCLIFRSFCFQVTWLTKYGYD